MSILCRVLLPLEAAQYRTLRLESLRLYPDEFESEYEAQKALPELVFETYIKNPNPSRFIVGAFSDAGLVGICGFYLEDDNVSSDLIQMYVKPDFQGKSIGDKLVQKVIEEAFKIDRLTEINLEVRRGNIAALKTYEKAGFGWVSDEDGFVQMLLFKKNQ